jgi:hypothetical protein
MDYAWTYQRPEQLKLCWCPACRGRGIIGKAASNVRALCPSLLLTTF